MKKKRWLMSIIVFCMILGTMGTTAKPKDKKNFVLVHGAFHGAWCWYKIVDRLRQDGHIATAVELPGHGISFDGFSDITLDDYVSHVSAVVDAQEGPVILMGHSMGGIVISAVAEAAPEKIEKLIYLAAFLVESGQSLFDLAVRDPGSVVGQNLIVDPTADAAYIPHQVFKPAFYTLTPHAEYVLAASLLRKEPFIPFTTPVYLTTGNYESVRRFYIKTRYDKAITPDLQERMLTAVPCETVYELTTDHSPFFSNPKELMKRIDRILKE